MSVFKPFLTSDVILSPFEVNKSFTFKGDSELTSSNVEIDRYIGQNITSSLWVSGSNPTGQINIQDKILVYNSIKELYYSNFLTSPSGSPAGTASFNPDGTITGPAYTPNYYNYLSTTLPSYRYIPTGSGDIIGVISIPSNLFGEYLKPSSFTLTSGSLSLTDDGLGNILSSSVNVGNIIYEHGIIILTQGSFINNFITTPYLTCSFESTVTIYESQYKCTLRENEFNFSQNPTLVSGSTNSGIMYGFATGSYFTPYITTIGLYNNNYELIAIGKLAQPLPTSAVTDTTILVNLDL
jgi:hypothetical protein